MPSAAILDVFPLRDFLRSYTQRQEKAFVRYREMPLSSLIWKLNTWHLVDSADLEWDQNLISLVRHEADWVRVSVHLCPKRTAAGPWNFAKVWHALFFCNPLK